MNKKFIHKVIGIISLFLLILLFAYKFVHVQHTEYGNGLGWDGIAYAHWAQADNIFDLVHNKTLDKYHIQRIFPSIVVHYGSKIAHYDIKSNENIIFAFKTYDTFLIFFSAIFLWRIAKYLKWKPQVYYLSFAAVFLNSAIMHDFFYNPNLTDITAFFLGISAYYCFIKDKLFWLIIITIIGAFTFPDMLYALLPLITFKILDNKGEDLPNQLTKKNNLIAVIISFFMIIIALYIIPTHKIEFTLLVDRSLLPISAVCLFLYIFYTFRYYLTDLKIWIKKIFHSIIFSRLLLTAILFCAIQLFINFNANHEAVPLSFFTYARVIASSSLYRPLYNVLQHIIFYGPIILLVIFLWNDIYLVIQTQGVGIFLFIIGFVIIGLDSESRHLFNAFPIFAILTCEALNRRYVSWQFSYLFAALAYITLIELPLFQENTLSIYYVQLEKCIVLSIIIYLLLKLDYVIHAGKNKISYKIEGAK
jgi:hypothetical protein